MKKISLTVILLALLSGCTNEQDYLPGPYKEEDKALNINNINKNDNKFGGNI